MFKIGDIVRLIGDNGIMSEQTYIVVSEGRKLSWMGYTYPNTAYIVTNIHNKKENVESFENSMIHETIYYRRKKLKKICSKLET